jgi:hypothetical protein
LEGALGNLWRGTLAAMRRSIGRAGFGWHRFPLAAAMLVLVLLMGASTAQANQTQTILEKCGHNESVAGFSQNAYREALKHIPTEVVEYSPCVELIRKAELAAAGGGVNPGAAGSSAAGVALPLTPSEQHAVQSAHRSGSLPVQVGSEPIRPGVVHANIASAVNTLPHSLFAVLAFIFVGALAIAIGEARKRVRAGRDG